MLYQNSRRQRLIRPKLKLNLKGTRRNWLSSQLWWHRVHVPRNKSNSLLQLISMYRNNLKGYRRVEMRRKDSRCSLKEEHWHLLRKMLGLWMNLWSPLLAEDLVLQLVVHSLIESHHMITNSNKTILTERRWRMLNLISKIWIQFLITTSWCPQKETVINSLIILTRYL